MATGIQVWAKTASVASNGSADSGINFAEGQSPGSVNDSCRMVMARLADLYADMGGITTGGSSTAFTVTTNRAFASAAAMDKSTIWIIPNADSGANPTLSVDTLTARAINYSTGVAVPAGALKSGTVYAVVYIHASTEFILLGAAGALSPMAGPCPVGMISDYGGTSAPTGWLLCFGQSLVRTDYAALFAAIGTTYGAADGTHFSLPDCRGRVVAGKDDMGGSSANRLTDQSGGLDGDTLGDTGGAETHTLTAAQMASHTHTGTTSSNGAHTHTYSKATGPTTGEFGGNAFPNLTTDTTSSDGAHTHTFTTASAGSDSPHNNVQPTIVLNKIIFAGI